MWAYDYLSVFSVAIFGTYLVYAEHVTKKASNCEYMTKLLLVTIQPIDEGHIFLNVPVIDIHKALHCLYIKNNIFLMAENGTTKC